VVDATQAIIKELDRAPNHTLPVFLKNHQEQIVVIMKIGTINQRNSIKNPTKLGKTQRLKSTIGTYCTQITATKGTTLPTTTLPQPNKPETNPGFCPAQPPSSKKYKPSAKKYTRKKGRNAKKAKRRLTEVKLRNKGETIRRFTLNKSCNRLTTTNINRKSTDAINTCFLLNVSTRTSLRSTFTLENLGRTQIYTRKPTSPTENIHQAIEDPKIKGGNEMANPTKNIGRNRLNPRIPQIANVFQSLRTACSFLTIIFCDHDSAKRAKGKNMRKTNPKNAARLTRSATSRPT
jgi:hypothetical protein